MAIYRVRVSFDVLVEAVDQPQAEGRAYFASEKALREAGGYVERFRTVTTSQYADAEAVQAEEEARGA